MISFRHLKTTVKIRITATHSLHRIAQVTTLTLMKMKMRISMIVIKMMGIKVEKQLKKRKIVEVVIILKKEMIKHLGIDREVLVHLHSKRI